MLKASQGNQRRESTRIDSNRLVILKLRSGASGHFCPLDRRLNRWIKAWLLHMKHDMKNGIFGLKQIEVGIKHWRQIMNKINLRQRAKQTGRTGQGKADRQTNESCCREMTYSKSNLKR